MIKRIFLCILILNCTFFVQGQSMRPKGSFQVGIGLPVSLANEVFKGIMQGLVNGSILYNYTLKNSISFGAGVNYTYFNVNEFKVNEPLFGGMHTPAAFLKIGLEKFHSSNFGTDFSIKVGYAESFITTNLNRENGVDPYRVSSTYFEPIIGLILVGDEETAFKFNFSFATYGFGFRPNYLGLKSNAGYDPVDFTKVVTHISVGFSYVHYFRMY